MQPRRSAVLSPSFGALVSLRAVQGVAGAAVVCGALDLLSATMETKASAARVWILAGVIGASFGPAVGGILTQLFGWESIFLVQVPLVLLGLLALGGAARVPAPPLERPHVWANTALLLVSGALVAALFLLVILLINGWRIDPLVAGLVVTVMPLAAIAAARFADAIPALWVRAASGAILISGGLAALAWLPRAGRSGRCRRSCSSGPGSGSPSRRSPSVRSPDARHRRCKEAGRSRPATQGSCSGCYC